jgi:hypothetical protein
MTVEFAEHAYIKKLEADFKRLHDIVGGMGFADMIQRISNLIAEVEKQDAEIERLQSLVDAELYPVAEVVAVDFTSDEFVNTTSTKSRVYSYREVRLVPGAGMPPVGTKLYLHPFKG